MAEIKQIKVPGVTAPYEIGGLYIQDTDTKSTVSGLKTWADIKELVESSFVLSVVWSATEYASTTAPSAAKLGTIPKNVKVKYNSGASEATGTLVASADTQNTLYLIYDTNSFYEYATTVSGSSYSWEKIGSTDIDLKEYAKKGTYTSGGPSSNETGSGGAQTASGTATVTYSKSAEATESAGGHNHTVTAPTSPFVTGVKSSGGTANALTGVKSTGSETFVKSYPGVTKYLKTGSVTGVSGSTTASKATAGTAVTVAKKAATATTVGNANVGTAVSFKAVNASTDVNATNIVSPTVSNVTTISSVTAGSDASLSAGAQAQWTATVTSGVLSFGFTPNTLQSLTGGKATVVSTVTTTGVVRSTATTPSASAVVASKVTTTDKSIAPAVASTATIYGVGDTVNITPYTFENVTVPVAASASNFVTGVTTTAATGMEVLTGLGTASTGTAITGVDGNGTVTVILSTGLTTSGAVTSVTLTAVADHTHSIELTNTTITGTASVAVTAHTHSLSNHTHSTTI